MADTMKAAVYRGKNDIHIEEVPIPKAGFGEAIVKITLTTICGTDVHIWKNEYPVDPGRIVGHEPVGVIHELGEGVVGYNVGDRVVVGAITPCGTCKNCLTGNWSQCVGYDGQWQPIGGWRLGNSIDGVQAEYFRVPYAQANLAKIPDELTDEDVVLVTDIASTGISGAESAPVKIGDTVVVFAQGPIGLCATAGAKLMGASFIIGVDAVESRLNMSKRMGADAVINFKEQDPVAEVKRLTGGWGVDVAIEALGQQSSFENCLKSVHPAGTVSSLGVYSHDVDVPLVPFIYGIGDINIVTTLCPGGKDRMHRLMEMVRTKRLDLRQLLTHKFTLDDITDAYEFFSKQMDGCMKVALYPDVNAARRSQIKSGELVMHPERFQEAEEAEQIEVIT